MFRPVFVAPPILCQGSSALAHAGAHVLTATTVLVLALTVTADDAYFADQVEPVLQQYCFECHSHAAGEISGGLALDYRRGWAEGGGRGPAIVPGSPSASLLVTAIQHSDADLRMPPDEKLPADKIELLIEWIGRGAPDPRTATPPATQPAPDPADWWSLRPLARPVLPPATAVPATSVTPIDRFIDRRLHEHGLVPLPTADRQTLIRRVTIDLHGLQPTPQQVAAFVADPDPRAYEKLIDRLLESPRYGERWARHWLDAVHFADSHGCEHDVFRPAAWRYRDYVIDSFNADTPWDTFIRQQLAADHFYPERSDLIPALGFIAAGPLELSRAGTAPVTFDYLDRDDMVTQTMAAFASTTANCARCHDHKFDPISQADYYALQAVFAGIGKGPVPFDTDPAIARQRRHWTGLVADASDGHLRQPLSESLIKVVDRWEQQLTDRAAIWQTLVPETFSAPAGTVLQRLGDHSLLAGGERPDTDTYTVTAIAPTDRLTALRLEVLTDASLPEQGPGRADNGNLHLSELETLIFYPGESAPQRLKFASAAADWNQEGWAIDRALDGDVTTAWGIFPRVGQSHHAVFKLPEPLQLKPGSRMVVMLKQLHGTGHTIGRFRIQVTGADPETAQVLPEPVLAAIQIPARSRTDQQQAAIDAWAIRLHAQQQLDRLPAPATVYAVSNRFSHAKPLDQPMEPKLVHVLRRGDIHQPGAIAEPGALSAISQLPGRFDIDGDSEASRRAALADWLAAPENPLTWRSIVNRVWSHHFGRGICDTPNDFGRMGGNPSHPQLLDYLAVWFRDDAGGSLKQLHRLILTSGTYRRQSQPATDSAPQQSAAAIDAENRLLWRMNRRSLDAESFRDSVLQISGRIDLAMGGPGIQQFVKSKGAQATPKLDYAAYDWNDPGGARRSIYRVVWRGIPDPFMEALCFPDLGLLAPTRDFSASALQALSLYNNDFVLHHCRQLAQVLASESSSLDQQVARAVELIYLRSPTAAETTALVRFAQQHGLAAVGRVLLCSNEFLFVD